MQAMIFAAGLGTRLLNETSNKPKALVEIGGKPLIQQVIEKLTNEGITKIVVNVHHFSGQIIRFIRGHNFGVSIEISDESNELLETGGALKKAAPFFLKNAPVLIYNVDIISHLNIRELVSFHLNSGALATLAVRNRQTQRYLKFDSDNNLVGWYNKKTGENIITRPENYSFASEMAFSGIHVVNPEIFQFMPEKNKFPIMNFYLELSKKHAVKGFYDTSDLWIDAGKPGELAYARKMLS